VNRIKSTLARLGIRNFKPTLRKAFQRRTTRGQGASEWKGCQIPRRTK